LRLLLFVELCLLLSRDRLPFVPISSNLLDEPKPQVGFLRKARLDFLPHAVMGALQGPEVGAECVTSLEDPYSGPLYRNLSRLLFMQLLRTEPRVKGTIVTGFESMWESWPSISRHIGHPEGRQGKFRHIETGTASRHLAVVRRVLNTLNRLWQSPSSTYVCILGLTDGAGQLHTFESCAASANICRCNRLVCLYACL
jgi:hypothetical protein